MIATPESPTLTERSLDPESWDEVRALLHRAVDDSIDWLSTVRDRPVWQPMPEAERERLRTLDVPWDGVGLESVYRDVLEHVRPYSLGNVHPRFWGWVPGSGTAGGIVAELLKATANSVSAAFDEADRLLEQQVVRWMLEILGMPTQGSGILVSGGSMANFVGLAVGRDAMLGDEVRERGLVPAGPRPVLYASSATHNSVDKAVQLLGLGRESLRRLPVGHDHRLDLDLLREAIAEDRRRGWVPFAVVANAGTVDIGATDDLDAVADLCGEQGLWLHVDGAFGALVALSEELGGVVSGIGRADSVAFDFHKWLHVQYAAGCTLFRDEQRHRAAFTVPAAYLAQLERGTGAQSAPSHRFGPELSRETKALRIWMSLREHGLRRFGEQIEQNVAQARVLAALVERHPRLELMAPVPLNIVCYRVLPARGGRRSGEASDALNREVLMRLQERGIAVPSQTTLHGRFCIRVCLTSHRTRRDDLDLLIAKSVELAEEIEREGEGNPASAGAGS